ncbi:MAG: hypothetical protein OEV64_05980 [Desulfobulbaceae bacterium]|nr:hypothetical protein [Desulfobulbaceae bacterium]
MASLAQLNNYRPADSAERCEFCGQFDDLAQGRCQVLNSLVEPGAVCDSFDDSLVELFKRQQSPC